MLSFLRYLKSMVRSSNAVAVVTFPPSLLSPSFSKRWQHMADTLLSVRAIPGLDLATMSTFLSLTSLRIDQKLLQMRIRNQQSSSLATKTWLVFSMCIKQLKSIHRYACLQLRNGLNGEMLFVQFFHLTLASLLFCVFLLVLVHT